MAQDVIKEFILGLAFGKPDTRELDKAGKEAKRVADATAKHWKDATDKIKKGFDEIKSAGKMLAVAGTAAVGAAAGLFKLAEGAAKAGDEIAKGARAAGVSADSFQRLQFLANRSGVEMTTLSQSVRKLGKNMLDASSGGAKMFTDSLDAVGLTLSDLQGLKPEEQIGVLADALQGVTDPATRTAHAMNLFGEEGGAKLASLLELGSKGMSELSDEAERLGLIMSKDALDASEEFTDAIGDLKGMVGAIARDIGIGLIPVMKSAIEQVQKWIIENRALIQQKLEGAIQSILKIFQQLLPVLMQILPLIATMAEHAVALTAAVGPAGATAAMLGFKAAASGALGPIGLLITAFAALAATILTAVENEQDLAQALDEFKAGGRATKRGAPGFVGSAREGQLQADRRRLAAGLKTDAEIRGETGSGPRRDFLLKENARKRKRVELLDARIARERAKGASSADKGSSVVAGARSLGSNIAQRGADQTEFKALTRKKGAKKKTEIEFDAEDFEFDDDFGDKIRQLGEKAGVGDAALNAAIKAGGSALREGSTKSVARQAALSRLSAASGEDYSAIGSGKDPLLSEIFGDNVPDIELSSLAMGAQPQTLIATINNSFAFDIDQAISGAGDPVNVGSAAAAAIRDAFEGALAKSTKLAKVNWSR